jgi:hypothetical protein
MLVLVGIGVLCFWWFVNVLYSLMPILAHDYLLIILLWSPFVDSLLFYKFWHDDGYNCSNTCLYAL